MDDRGEAPVSTTRTSAFTRLEHRLRAWGNESLLGQHTKAFYKRYHRFTPAMFFVGGVVWDGATLRRIDAWLDTALLLTYIIALGILIIVSMLVAYHRTDRPILKKYEAWYPSVIQFFLGALFSAYFIFYLQSASFQTETIVFILVLVGLLVANEFLHHKLLNPYLVFALYFLASASFFIFMLPILTKRMGYGVFLVGAVLSLLLVAGMLWFLKRKRLFEDIRQFYYALGLVAALFGMLNLFYVMNWIPPVPLALRDGDIYRGVVWRGDEVVLTYKKPHWAAFWVDSDRAFRYAEGDTVHCFTAIFAPTELKTDVYHAWYRYDEGQEAWLQTDRIPFSVEGGRDRGYRGYTQKRQVAPGKWRVDVMTSSNRTLGRIPFLVVPVDERVTEVVEKIYR